MTLGRRVADWLRAYVNPEAVYDQKQLSNLAQVGIDYNESAHMLSLPTGEIAPIKTYSPAELVMHPDLAFKDVIDNGSRWVLGFEISIAVHMLMWPGETVPATSPLNAQRTFDLNLASIAQRDERPYRDNPAAGWWYAPKKVRSHK